jgi:hypothetical protein
MNTTVTGHSSQQAVWIYESNINHKISFDIKSIQMVPTIFTESCQGVCQGNKDKC